jgi:hypothetical protein
MCFNCLVCTGSLGVNQAPKSRISFVVSSSYFFLTLTQLGLLFCTEQALNPEGVEKHKGELTREQDTMEITSETSTVLDLPPSAVAFCPSRPEYYVVGTYFLHPKENNNDGNSNSNGNGNSNSEESSSSEAPQKRTGTLILYRLEGSVL